jgi:hypothetical protein
MHNVSRTLSFLAIVTDYKLRPLYGPKSTYPTSRFADFVVIRLLCLIMLLKYEFYSFYLMHCVFR